MSTVYLSLGSNLGNRQAWLKQAEMRIGQLDRVTVKAISSYYETPPWGKTDQPSFLNSAIAVTTTLTPQELLQECQRIETELGRVRHEKWGARTLDIDFVYSPQVMVHTTNLILPHPYLVERAFVLLPLAEIAPDLQLFDRPIQWWLSRLPEREKIVRSE